MCSVQCAAQKAEIVLELLIDYLGQSYHIVAAAAAAHFVPPRRRRRLSVLCFISFFITAIRRA